MRLLNLGVGGGTEERCRHAGLKGFGSSGDVLH